MAAEFSMCIDGRTDTIQTDMTKLTVAEDPLLASQNYED
jgi:hypothetical protein